MDNVKSQTAGTIKIERPVVNENTLLRRALRDLKSYAENGLFRLARTDVAGTEKDEKIPPQIKCFDAVLVQLERFIIDRTNKVLPTSRGVRENCSSVGILFGLREHKASELFTRKRTRAVKESPIQIFVQRN